MRMSECLPYQKQGQVPSVQGANSSPEGGRAISTAGATVTLGLLTRSITYLELSDLIFTVVHVLLLQGTPLVSLPMPHRQESCSAAYRTPISNSPVLYTPWVALLLSPRLQLRPRRQNLQSKPTQLHQSKQQAPSRPSSLQRVTMRSTRRFAFQAPLCRRHSVG